MQRAAAILVLCSLWTLQAAAVKELSGWEKGILTHYGGAQDNMRPDDPSFGSKEGACGYGAISKDRWPYFSVAALSPSNKFYQAGPLGGCGQCFQIQCESGMDDFHKDACYKDSTGKPKSILVMISDVCPECGNDHIDVQSLAFAKLTNPGIGRVKISYRRIECTPPEDMKVSVMDFVGSNGWLRLSIDGTGGRGAVQSVQVKGSSSGSWVPMRNSWGATWELGSAPVPPLDFKIATDDGEEVVASGVIKQAGGINQGAFGSRIKFNTGVQFAINDPAVTRVQAASGPGDSSDPMVATSDTPGNGDGSQPSQASAALPNAALPSNSAGGQPCVDVSAPGDFSCQQQKDFGKCDADYMRQGNYCAATCGRCSGSATSSPVPDTTTAPPTNPSPVIPSPATTASQPSGPSAVPTPAPNEGNLAAAGSCTDIPPDGSASCAQRKQWGQCNDSITTSRNYCAATCGRCTGDSGAASTQQQPVVQSFSGPAESAGRKLRAASRHVHASRS